MPHYIFKSNEKKWKHIKHEVREKVVEKNNEEWEKQLTKKMVRKDKEERAWSKENLDFDIQIQIEIENEELDWWWVCGIRDVFLKKNR